MVHCMEKRGAAHIEMILSFIIFIVAVAFALYFFRPTESNRLIESSLTYTFREIEENASVLVKEYNIVIKEESAPSELGVETNEQQTGSRAFGESGNSIDSYVDGDGIIYIKTLSGWTETRIVKVVLSDEFQNSPIGGLIDTNFCEISSSDEKEIISEKRFIELIDLYEENYTEIKKDFNLPNRVNFDFSLEFEDGTLIEPERETPPVNAEVYSDSKRIEILRENGVEFAELRARVW